MDRYEEALERAKAGKPIDEVFPELKESEDERIRKILVQLVEDAWAGRETAEVSDEKVYHACLAFLEEQQPDDVKMEWWNKGYLEGRKNAHIPARELGLPSFLDFRQQPAEWSEEDEKKLSAVLFSISRFGGEEHLKTKGYKYAEISNWLKSLRPQPKQEWSEEDVERLAKNRAFKSGTLKSEMIFYRQGVRDAFNYKGMRPHWKPSEEQMNELRNAVSLIATPNKVILDELYFDLKKLM